MLLTSVEIVFGENRVSTAVDMNYANNFAQQESSLSKADLQDLVNSAK